MKKSGLSSALFVFVGSGLEPTLGARRLGCGAQVSCLLNLEHVCAERGRQYRLQAVQFLHLTTPKMRITGLRKVLCTGLLLAVSLTTASGQCSRASNPSPAIPANILLR